MAGQKGFWDFKVRRLRNSLFWKHEFDREFEHHAMFFRGFDDYLLDEKRYHWRESLGRRMEPELAVYMAVRDFADDYYRRHRDDPKRRPNFEEIGYALYGVAFKQCLDEQKAINRIGASWAPCAKDCKKAREEDKAQRQTEWNEIVSFQFPVSEIDRAWAGLLSGEIGPEPRSVWRATRQRRSAHEIAQSSLVSLERTMFWLTVFRRQNIVNEQVVMNRML